MEHSAETQARALATLATGGTVRGVARELGLSPSTVRRWRDAAHLPATRPNFEEQRDELGRLMWEYLTEGLKTMIAQAQFARDPSWLKAQSADHFALAHGVMTDKIFRLIGSLREPDNLDVDRGTPYEAGDA
jgi:transposase-like protein